MVLLFGLGFLLLLISAPIIVLRFGIRSGGKRELGRSKPELERSERNP